MARTRSGRYHGRHRLGMPGLMHCRALLAMAAALRARKSGWQPARHDAGSVRARMPRVPAPVVPLSVPSVIDSPAQRSRLAA